MLTKDTKPRRGDVGNVFWGLVAEPILEVPLCFQSVFSRLPSLPLPARIKAHLLPSGLTTAHHPIPARRREVRSVYGPLLLLSHALFPQFVFLLCKQSILMKTNTVKACVSRGRGRSLATSSQIALCRWRGFMVPLNGMHSFQAVPFTVQLFAFYHVIDWGWRCRRLSKGTNVTS